ncbi:GerAB/ArcD/ProY family transporter [Ornithinibacillus sp. L9]|uniref:GerAB/ArcD/ProY family transporter n=2 Tax=Ornithinibacillus caprae TaxID=2678566 RepID=A0A6N8FHW7_9BACI|nr:GerAB/ArcD/ProY family transporter [Ornithinibacillus caprae]
MVSPFLAFFLIHSIQFGIGILNFQGKIIERVGNDAWIAVIFGGILIHIIIWLIFKILIIGNGDLITIHYDVFGKWIGGFFSLVWILYFWAIGIIVLRTYVEVIQVWMFQDISVIFFTITFLLLVYYIVSGGFRIVTGISFLGVVIPAYLLLTLIYPLNQTEFRNILPIWDHSTTEILLASKDMTLSFLGFSTLLMFYPYLKHANKSKLWVHGANFITMFIYLGIMIISLAYFSQKHLLRYHSPTLTMWKSVELPFVERFEYVGISSWALIILPNICLAFWAASRGMRQLFRFSQRKALIGMLLFTIFPVYIIKEREHIEVLNDYISHFGFYLITCYLPILLVVTYFRKGRRKKH